MYLRMVAIFDHFRCFLAIFTSNVALENALEPACRLLTGVAKSVVFAAALRTPEVLRGHVAAYLGTLNA